MEQAQEGEALQALILSLESAFSDRAGMARVLLADTLLDRAANGCSNLIGMCPMRVVLLVLLLLFPCGALAQSGSSVEIGASTFYSLGDLNGSSQSVGRTEFYGFNNGMSTTRTTVGSTDFYGGSSPSLSGSTTSVGGTTFGAWQDGSTSTHTTIGGSAFHSFSNGRNCASTRNGASTFTSCY